VGHAWSLASNTVAWWKLDDASMEDYAIADEKATYAGVFTEGYGLYPGNQSVGGQINNALSLYFIDLGEGTYEYAYITMGDVLDMASGAFSISLWAYSAASGVDQYLVCKGLASSSAKSYYVKITTTGAVAFGTSSNGSSYSAVTTTATPFGTAGWHHVVITKTSNVGNIYVDGVLSKTGTVTSALYNSADPLALGISVDSGGSFQEGLNGIMDDVRVFNKLLSAAEVIGLYKSKSVAEAGGWPLDVTGHAYVSGSVIAQEFVMLSDPDEKTEKVLGTLPVAADLQTALMRYSFKSQEAEAAKVGMTAPEVVGFDASRLPAECVREIGGKRYVVLSAVSAVLADQAAKNAARIEALEAAVGALDARVKKLEEARAVK